VRLARLALSDRVVLARVEGEAAVPLVTERRDPAADALRDALLAGVDLTAAGTARIELSAATLLAPVSWPQKVLAIGLNYADHARETGQTPPSSPITFAKMGNSIVGPGAAVTWSADASAEVDYEAELAVVIGRRASHVPVARALDHVLGYTCCNDVSARDAQFRDGQWVRGKSFDSFCPLGPWIVTTDEIPDPQVLGVRCRVNGETLQSGSTADMIFGVAEVVSYLSRFLTLEPGDVIATGTPAGVGFTRTPPVFLRDGDLVEVEIEGIGCLANPVAVRPAPEV
jgi:2-keto-4-pentenoate hydratase/2-oxohepta-3-ene-1,7-dioic acid hydratase in catechol pathway